MYTWLQEQTVNITKIFLFFYKYMTLMWCVEINSIIWYICFTGTTCILKKTNEKGWKMKSKLREFRGITLIALVITIIILLVLAGIAMATLGGENGLFPRVKLGMQRIFKFD